MGHVLQARPETGKVTKHLERNVLWIIIISSSITIINFLRRQVIPLTPQALNTCVVLGFLSGFR